MTEINSKKRKRAITTSGRIYLQGVKMSDKCSYCEKHDKECVVSSASSRCSECFQKQRKCDASGPSQEDWEALEREEAKIQKEELRLLAEKRELHSKLLRLERLDEVNREKRNNFRARAARMLRLGVKSFDELDALEAKEKEEEARGDAEAPATREASQDDSFVPPSSPGVIFDFPSPSASFWESLDAGGETPQATRGS